MVVTWPKLTARSTFSLGRLSTGNREWPYYVQNRNQNPVKNLRRAFSKNNCEKIISDIILLTCVLSSKDSIFQTRKNVFYLISKTFVLEIFKF